MPALKPPPTPLAQEIRTCRITAGLTQDQLADLLGIEQATVSRWEQGRLPSPEHYELLAVEIGCDRGLWWPQASARTAVRFAGTSEYPICIPDLREADPLAA